MKNIVFVYLVALLGIAPASFSQQLKLAVSSAPTSLDPHAHAYLANINLSEHIYETLVKLDLNSQPVPALAESWKVKDGLVWEFKLRRGVQFHDGSEFTSEDVIWSLKRIAEVSKAPKGLGGFVNFSKAMTAVRALDAFTIEIKTEKPYPMLLADLSMLFIVSKKSTSGSLPQGIASDSFNSQKSIVGTGPFKFVSYQSDQKINLERFANYWDKKNEIEWKDVSIFFMPVDATRIAALLAGGVDAIDSIPPTNVAAVQSDSRLNFFNKVSHRLIYLSLDQRDQSPFVFDKLGRKLEKNPLKDLRVRQALSLAINRAAIQEKIMNRMSVPTNNLVPRNLFGFNPELTVPVVDVVRAKQLLKDAGYPDGFKVVLHGPNDRYVNGTQIMVAISSMWAKIGVTTEVKAITSSVFFDESDKKSYSIAFTGFGAQTGESSGPLRLLLGCEDAKTGFGFFNMQSYCNPKMDDLLKRAIHTINNDERLALLKESAKIAIDDASILPIHNQVNTWASRRGLFYQGRTDERTHAYEFSTKQKQ